MARLISTALISLAVLAAGCSQKTVSEADRMSADSTLRPDYETHGATNYLYEGGQVTAEIRADLIRRFEAIDSTMGYVLDIDFLDSLGRVKSNLVADSGVIREKNDQLEVFGKVVVITRDSARLDTDFLRWNPERRKIESEAFVKFIREGSVMAGWGMEADPDLGRLKILSQVSGSVSKKEITSGE
jgi:LPS export ABC transporter protein LptC